MSWEWFVNQISNEIVSPFNNFDKPIYSDLITTSYVQTGRQFSITRNLEVALSHPEDAR